MKKFSLLFLSAIAFMLFFSCTEDNFQPSQKEILDMSLEPELGRVMFYDRQLSVNNSVSCASCHKQELAFADNVAFSPGVAGHLTERNSMPIQNLGSFNIVFRSVVGNFSQSLFWDGRESNLNTMLLRPIVNHKEMGVNDLDALCEKLEKLPYYEELFMEEYGDTEITPERISESMMNFIMTITSTNTKFDRTQSFGFPPDKPSVLLTEKENFGKTLFFEKYRCNDCHNVQTPTGYIFAGTFANIGLDNVYSDQGRFEVTGLEEDKGKFKIPSLRNVALTAPYMHDGRFATLDDVIDHYNHMANHPNLDHKLKDLNGNPKTFSISDYEKESIVAFLHTLTDEEMITNPDYANPFKTVDI